MKFTRRPLILAASLAALSAGAWLLPAQTSKPAPVKSPPAQPVPATAPAPQAEAANFQPAAPRGLSSEQRERLAELRRTHREQLQAIRDDASLTPEQKREKARASLVAARQEMASTLTPEQQQRFRHARQQMHERRRHAARAWMHQRLAGWHERQARFGGPPARGFGWGPGRISARGFAPGHGMAPGRDFPPRFHGAPGQPFGPGGHRPGVGDARGIRPPDAGFAPGRGPGGFRELGLSEEQKSKVEALHRKHREQAEQSRKAFQEEFRGILTPEQQQKLDARRPSPPSSRP